MHVFVAGDVLQECVSAGLHVDGVRELVERANTMVRLIHSSSAVLEVLLEHLWRSGKIAQSLDKLAPCDNGRWESSHEMLLQVAAMRLTIIATAADVRLAADHKDKFVTQDDLAEIDRLLRVLKPMKTVEAVLSEEKNPIISLILPLMVKLTKEVTSLVGCGPLVDGFREAFLPKITDRSYLEAGQATQVLLIATLLDPRFKSLGFLNRTKEK